MNLRTAIPVLFASAMLAQDAAPDRAIQREAALGGLMAKQFRERHGTVDIPEVQAYLQRIVGELAAAQPGDGPCCSVELFAREEAPAKPVGYPGGHLFVPAKLFFTSADEDAFVLALAHAVAHIRLRDWSSGDMQASSIGNVSPTVIWADDDQAENMPRKMRPEFEARERRADEAAARSARAVATGTGEFERVRDLAPLPTPRPSLLP